MTTAQHDLDRWFTALAPGPNTAARCSRPITAVAEDFTATWAELESRRTHRQAQSGARRRLAIIAATGCVATLSIAVVLWLPNPVAHSAGASGPRPAHPLPSAATAASASAATGACPRVPVVTGSTVTGAAAGGTGSGPDAVMAFETAYYTARSGVAARAVTTADAQVPAASVIQAGIDSIPAGTGFCVVVRPGGPDAWQVDLTETRPGRRPTLYRQTVTTAGVDGRVLITGITQR